MKKLMTIAALFVTTTTFAACDREDIIPESRLPAESRTFLRTHFKDVGITRVVREVDGLEKDYSVYLNNGFEINFGRSGAWDEIEGHSKAIPASIMDLLPAGIASYVAENYPDRPIVTINREHYGYEIELGRVTGADGTVSGREVELDFTEAGEFFRYDD